MLRLLVIEDHALVREGLVQTLRQLEAEVSVLEAGDCDQGCALLEREEDFDLVLLDLALPGVDGLTCLSIIRQRYPAVPVVIVSAYDDAHTVNRAIKAGAAGFVSKAYSGERMLEALRQVLDGQMHVPEGLLAISPVNEPVPVSIGKSKPQDFGLTERQTKVLSLMVRGKSNREIAELMGLTEGTVKVHVTAIFKALKVSSRTQALVSVARYGIRL